MTILQQPDSYSLTSMIKELIISAENDILFEILSPEESLLIETYTPDAENRIHIRDLGVFFEKYLSGTFDTGAQTGICKNYTLKMKEDTGSAVAQSVNISVLLCKSSTQVAPEMFFGNRFLNLQYTKKITLPAQKEFITARANANNKILKVKLLCRNGNRIVPSAETNLITLSESSFHTVDVSFLSIVKLFPAVDKKTVVAYIIHFADVFLQYQTDWETYLDAKYFIYLNSFGVPESLAVRGEIFRKGVSTFDSANINRIEHKLNIRRADTFEVNAGKIYTPADYALFREMFSSEDVKIFFAGKYRKIIITDENMNTGLRPGNLQSLKFTFRFADPADNLSLLDSYIWVLEDGTWNERRPWLDNGQWNDNPQ